MLLLRNKKSVSAHTVGTVALFLGGLGLTINVGIIVIVAALRLSGAAGLIVGLDLTMILGIQFPTLYIGYSKLKEKREY